jgi:cytochrome c-type biogenesis protein CcmH
LFNVAVVWLVLHTSHSALARSGRATELETRLFAPCCYVQTLDVHESELADKLRHEIEQRIVAAEAPQHIEDDLVARYGERIRAVPRDADPRGQIPLAVGLGLAGTLLALGLVALRWRGAMRRTARASRMREAPDDLRYDRDLDEALRSSE